MRRAADPPQEIQNGHARVTADPPGFLAISTTRKLHGGRQRGTNAQRKTWDLASFLLWAGGGPGLTYPEDPPSRGRLSFEFSFPRCFWRLIPAPAPSSERLDSTISMQSECLNECTPRTASSRSSIVATLLWMLTIAPRKTLPVRYGSTKNWVRSRERPQRGSSPTAAIPDNLKFDGT